MELCNLRNDPTGSLRYSQEEGLSKRTIERLPHTRYKKPATPATSQNASKRVGGGSGALSSIISGKKKKEEDGVVEGGGSGDGTGVEVHRSETVGQEATEAVVVEAGEGGGDRDSTADMCAICLVEYETGDELRVMPGCGHHFHKVGAGGWHGRCACVCLVIPYFVEQSFYTFTVYVVSHGVAQDEGQPWVFCLVRSEINEEDRGKYHLRHLSVGVSGDFCRLHTVRVRCMGCCLTQGHTRVRS